MSRNWDKLYRSYYKRYKQELAKSNVPIEPIYNKREFKAMYSSLESDRLQEIKAGKRKVLNITQDLVRSQKEYAYTSKQAKVLQQALKEQTGHKYSLKALREGNVQRDQAFWNAVRTFEGNVGQEFFGSK